MGTDRLFLHLLSPSLLITYQQVYLSVDLVEGPPLLLVLLMLFSRLLYTGLSSYCDLIDV